MSHDERKRDSSRAEQRFRSAFERLRLNAPEVLPAGSMLTQNNVAREAGCDPSALKRSRFANLIEEIKQEVRHREEAAKPKSKPPIAREKRRRLVERIRALVRQRDELASLLVEADLRIVDLTLENARLQQGPSGVVVDFRRKAPPKV